MTKKRLTFEEALGQLEAIARQIEEGKIGLEESIAQYEQGMTLVKHCREILRSAELKIQELHMAADGTLEAEALAPGKSPENHSAGGTSEHTQG